MRNIIGCLTVLFLLINCKGDSGVVHMNSLNGAWAKDNKQVFSLDIASAEESKDLFFLVRNNNNYAYSNIRFFVEFTNVKTKKTSVDTLNYILAKPNGEWLGKGFGNTKEILFQYKMNFKFPNSGKYKIGVKQAMRKDTLIGIEDLGVKIADIKP